MPDLTRTRPRNVDQGDTLEDNVDLGPAGIATWPCTARWMRAHKLAQADLGRAGVQQGRALRRFMRTVSTVVFDESLFYRLQDISRYLRGSTQVKAGEFEEVLEVLNSRVRRRTGEQVDSFCKAMESALFYRRYSKRARNAHKIGGSTHDVLSRLEPHPKKGVSWRKVFFRYILDHASRRELAPGSAQEATARRDLLTFINEGHHFAVLEQYYGIGIFPLLTSEAVNM